MKVLITAPSLDETKNVSGISTAVRQIIEQGPHEYSHFRAGREDGERSGFGWAVRQAALPLSFFWRIVRGKPDLVHINTALTDLSIWRDAALSRAARLAGRPVVLGIHGGKYLVNDFESKPTEKVAGAMLRAAKVVIVLSEAEKCEIDRRWKGLDVRVLSNAVPVRRERRLPRENNVPLIIFLGRLHESKGLHEIAKACEALTADGFDLRFNCFGEGPMKEVFLSRMAKILGDRFHYGGVVAGAEKQRELDSADIFLLPSLFGEGLPIAMLEAMAAGCVVIASEMASVGAVIDDGVNGYLVQPGDTAQLISRMKMILDSRSDWAAVGSAAVETVHQKFAIEDYVEKLDRIYRSAAASS